MPPTLPFSSPTLEKELASREWDAVVIGSGLGGLTAASLLARAGMRVLVLERHTVPGGFTHTFSRRGFEWDVGVHYVGQMGEPRQPLRRVFDYVTGGAVTWDAIGKPGEPGAIYDQVFIAGDRYDFRTGAEAQIAAMISHFPREEAAIRAYYLLVKRTAASGAWFFGEKSMPRWLSRLVGSRLRARFARQASRMTWDVLRELTDDPRLIAVLCAQCGDYGLTPRQSSFGIHAVVVEHYLSGASYPRGGARRIHEALTAMLRRHGGRLVLKAEVAEIVREDSGEVGGVRLKSGVFIRARKVISNAGARNTFARLLPDARAPGFDPVADLQAIAPSSAHLCLYVGLDGSDAELSLPQHNIWVYDRYDFEEAFAENAAAPEQDPALVYISFPSAKDTDWPAAHPGKSTVQVIAAYPYAHVKQWEHLPYPRREEEYRQFKARMTVKLTRALLKQLPQLRGRIAYSELSTPLSTRHFTNHAAGEIYGLAHTPARFALPWLRPETPIPNLYLTGQDIITVGVGGALFSGVIAAARVLDRFLFLAIFLNRPLARRRKSGEAQLENS